MVARRIKKVVKLMFSKDGYIPKNINFTRCCFDRHEKVAIFLKFLNKESILVQNATLLLLKKMIITLDLPFADSTNICLA